LKNKGKKKEKKKKEKEMKSILEQGLDDYFQ